MNKFFSKPVHVVICFLVLSFILRVIYALELNAVWSDVGVYVGMGKFIFSHGALGYWELFRPVLWPLILGAFWKLKANPLMAGKIIVLCSSIAATYVVYLLGKKVSEEVGLIAAVLFAFTPVYFMYGVIQITDVISLFFSLLAVYWAVNHRYVLAGLSVGVAFNLRFPHALTLIIIGLYVLTQRTFFETKLKRVFFVGCGAAAFIVPYLVLNQYWYGSIFFPIVEAQKVVGYTVIAGRGVSYYFVELLKNNLLLVFSLIGLFFYFRLFKQRRRVLDVVVIATVLLMVYFIHEPHKEVRYALAFLPYLCILSAFGMWQLMKKYVSQVRLLKWVMICVSILFIMYCVVLLVMPVYANDMRSPVESYYRYFENETDSVIFGYDAQFVAYGDVKLVRYVYWPSAALLYENTSHIDYATVNTCAVYCKSISEKECVEKQEYMLHEFAQHALVFNQTVDNCTYLIYDMSKRIEEVGNTYSIE